jgi:hypothetical protein
MQDKAVVPKLSAPNMAWSLFSKPTSTTYSGKNAEEAEDTWRDWMISTSPTDPSAVPKAKLI